MIINRYSWHSVVPLKWDLFWLYILWKMNFLIKNIRGDIFEKNDKWIEKRLNYHEVKKQTKKWLKDHYDCGTVPMFSSIEIETINRCNGECSFCPANRNVDPRTPKKMNSQLFYKIIDELGEMRYSGRLALHSNNEPFLDSRIIDFAKYARERVPNAFIYLYTNGTLVTLEKFKEIIPFLDRIIIDNYDDGLKLHENVREINLYCKKHAKLDRKVEIHLRKIHEVLNTRGGQSPNNKRKATLHMSCVLPYKQMIIRPDGKVSLCCNDPYGKYTLADLTKMTIREAWFSKRYKLVRENLRKGRFKVKLCRYCDTLPNPKIY